MIKPIKESWTDIEKLIPALILKYQAKKICEIGAGANPFLAVEFIQNQNLNYTLIDIDEGELAKNSMNVKKRIADFSSEQFKVSEKFDFIFSYMTLEHIKNPRKFHENVFASLKEGGVVVHFFATLFSISSCVNLILPESLSHRILFWIQKRDQEQHGKFPAYYNWCLGPLKKNIKRFESTGFKVLNYTGYVGHTYFPKDSFFGKIEASYSNFLYKLGSPYFTSNAIVTLKRETID